MELYHLCDFAQVFVQNVEQYKNLPPIEKVEVEAIIVSYLNHYAQNHHLPLSLYRSDLHEKGTIMNGRLPYKSAKKLDSFDAFVKIFLSSNCLDLINNKYKINTQLEKQVILTTNDVELVIKVFLTGYKKYIPEITYI